MRATTPATADWEEKLGKGDGPPYLNPAAVKRVQGPEAAGSHLERGVALPEAQPGEAATAGGAETAAATVADLRQQPGATQELSPSPPQHPPPLGPAPTLSSWDARSQADTAHSSGGSFRGPVPPLPTARWLVSSQAAREETLRASATAIRRSVSPRGVNRRAREAPLPLPHAAAPPELLLRGVRPWRPAPAEAATLFVGSGGAPPAESPSSRRARATKSPRRPTAPCRAGIQSVVSTPKQRCCTGGDADICTPGSPCSPAAQADRIARGRASLRKARAPAFGQVPLSPIPSAAPLKPHAPPRGPVKRPPALLPNNADPSALRYAVPGKIARARIRNAPPPQLGVFARGARCIYTPTLSLAHSLARSPPDAQSARRRSGPTLCTPGFILFSLSATLRRGTAIEGRAARRPRVARRVVDSARRELAAASRIPHQARPHRDSRPGLNARGAGRNDVKGALTGAGNCAVLLSDPAGTRRNFRDGSRRTSALGATRWLRGNRAGSGRPGSCRAGKAGRGQTAAAARASALGAGAGAGWGRSKTCLAARGRCARGPETPRAGATGGG